MLPTYHSFLADSRFYRRFWRYFWTNISSCPVALGVLKRNMMPYPCLCRSFLADSLWKKKEYQAFRGLTFGKRNSQPHKISNQRPFHMHYKVLADSNNYLWEGEETYDSQSACSGCCNQSTEVAQSKYNSFIFRFANFANIFNTTQRKKCTVVSVHLVIES